LQFGEADAGGLLAAAREIGLPVDLSPINDEDLAALYELPLVLVRPDGHVAWRGGQSPADAASVINTVRGLAAV